MPTPSLALTMIVKDVAPYIQKCLRSLYPIVFDEVVIVDTGSTDETKTLLGNVLFQVTKAFHIIDFTPRTNPEAFTLDYEEKFKALPHAIPGCMYTGLPMLHDFSAARQFGWDRCTSDYIFWIDADDIVENADQLKKVVDEMEASGTEAALLNYDYAQNEQGQSICKLLRERIVHRQSHARWAQPVHEFLKPLKKVKTFTSVNIVHQRHKYNIQEPVKNRNLKICAKWLELDRKAIEPRMLFYTAMEMRQFWPSRAIARFEEYCDCSTWDEERALAFFLCGTLTEKEKQQVALNYYARASMEFPRNPDSLFGAARIAFTQERWNDCINLTERGLKIAVEHPTSTLMWNPFNRNYKPYLYLAPALYNVRRFEDAISACDAAIKVCPDEKTVLALRRKSETALQQINIPSPEDERAFRMRADEPLLNHSIQIPENVMVAMALQMWKKIKESDQLNKARHFIDCLPDVIAEHPAIVEARSLIKPTILPSTGVTDSSREEPNREHQLTPPGTTGPSNDQTESAPQRHQGATEPTKISSTRQPLTITIWTGQAWERWSPASIATTGIGGSETATYFMARELVRLGHKVTVLSDCEGMEQDYEGATFVDYKRALNNFKDFTADIFICSRQIEALAAPWTFKKSFLWVHDVHVGARTPEIDTLLKRVDHVFCLSNWHKDFFLETYPQLPRDKIIVTKNGLDMRRFTREPKKIGNRLIYSSSPDRGLEKLLELMPKIKAQVPDVELHIYYGFDNWKKMVANHGSAMDKKRVEFLERSLEDMTVQGLVTYHGRVSQQALANAFLAAKVWAYPTWFTESNCISAMEAQAGGCVPVTTALAALPETVSHGYILKPPCTSPEYAQAFVKRVVSLLQDDSEREKYATAGRAYTFAMHGWEHVARHWENHFYQSLETQ